MGEANPSRLLLGCRTPGDRVESVRHVTSVDLGAATIRACKRVSRDGVRKTLDARRLDAGGGLGEVATCSLGGGRRIFRGLRYGLRKCLLQSPLQTVVAAGGG